MAMKHKLSAYQRRVWDQVKAINEEDDTYATAADVALRMGSRTNRIGITLGQLLKVGLLRKITVTRYVSGWYIAASPDSEEKRTELGKDYFMIVWDKTVWESYEEAADHIPSGHNTPGVPRVVRGMFTLIKDIRGNWRLPGKVA